MGLAGAWNHFAVRTVDPQEADDGIERPLADSLADFKYASR